MDYLPRKILLTPGPVTTTDTVKKALIVPDICHREEEFSQLIQEVRDGLTSIVHADEQYSAILYASSGTGVLEAVISSTIPDGKKILIINNGTYGERIIRIAEVYRLNYIAVSIPFQHTPDLTQVEEYLKHEPDIHAIAMVHHETSSGLLNPLMPLGELAKRYSCLFIVDAIASYAGIPINIQTSKIDFLVGTGNKCLQAMPGVSFVIAKKMALEACSTIKRSYYFDLYSQYQALEKEGLFRFTSPVQIIYALKQAIIEYNKESECSRYNRYKENFLTLVAGLEQMGFTFPIAEKNWSYLLILAQYHGSASFDFKKIHDLAYKKGFTIYPGKVALPNIFRLACIGDLYLKDIQNFLVLLEKILQG